MFGDASVYGGDTQPPPFSLIRVEPVIEPGGRLGLFCKNGRRGYVADCIADLRGSGRLVGKPGPAQML